MSEVRAHYPILFISRFHHVKIIAMNRLTRALKDKSFSLPQSAFRETLNITPVTLTRHFLKMQKKDDLQETLQNVLSKMLEYFAKCFAKKVLFNLAKSCKLCKESVIKCLFFGNYTPIIPTQLSPTNACSHF